MSVLMCKYFPVSKGLPGAVPQPGSHRPVPGQQQGASVDTSERAARDGLSSPGSGLFPETPGLLPCRHGDTPPLPAPGRGVR